MQVIARRYLNWQPADGKNNHDDDDHPGDASLCPQRLWNLLPGLRHAAIAAGATATQRRVGAASGVDRGGDGAHGRRRRGRALASQSADHTAVEDADGRQRNDEGEGEERAVEDATVVLAVDGVEQLGVHAA